MIRHHNHLAYTLTILDRYHSAEKERTGTAFAQTALVSALSPAKRQSGTLALRTNESGFWLRI